MMSYYIKSIKWVAFIIFTIVAIIIVTFTGCSRFDAADYYDPIEEMKGNCWNAYDEIIVGFDYICNHNIVNISEVTEIGDDTVILQDGSPDYLVQLGDLELKGGENTNNIRYEFYYDLGAQTILAYRCAFTTDEDNEMWCEEYVPLMNACYRTYQELPLPKEATITLHNNRIDEIDERFKSYEQQLAEGSPDVRVTIGNRKIGCDYVELFCETETTKVIGWRFVKGEEAE